MDNLLHLLKLRRDHMEELHQDAERGQRQLSSYYYKGKRDELDYMIALVKEEKRKERV